MKRAPYVAGYFYPKEKDLLIDMIKNCFLSELGPQKLPNNTTVSDFSVVGLISPHAGYVYSGHIAAYGYLRLSQAKKRKRVVIIGPNHQGIGAPFSLYSKGYWQTPLGDVKIDEEFSNFLLNKLSFLKSDEMAHMYEHSIEVQIPFLQYIFEDFLIIPIIVSSVDIHKLKKLGEAIYEFSPEETLLIASSDFSHYIESAIAERVDKKAISYILAKEPQKFLENVISKRLSICGFGPIVSLLYYVKKFLNIEPTLLRYGNSGEVTGDFSQVVAYASISFEM